MRIFVAGASGAVGRPLITELIRQGHTVIGMTQSDQGANRLIELGASPDAVYYGTKLRGASNTKARNSLNFRPRPLEWL